MADALSLRLELRAALYVMPPGRPGRAHLYGLVVRPARPGAECIRETCLLDPRDVRFV